MKIRAIVASLAAVGVLSGPGFHAGHSGLEPGECSAVSLDVRLSRYRPPPEVTLEAVGMSTRQLRGAGEIQGPPGSSTFYLVITPRGGYSECLVDQAAGGGPLRWRVYRGDTLVYDNTSCNTSALFFGYGPIRRGIAFPFFWDVRVRREPFHIRSEESCATTLASNGYYRVVAEFFVDGVFLRTNEISVFL